MSFTQAKKVSTEGSKSIKDREFIAWSNNSMKSTWYDKPTEELNWAQKFLRNLEILPDEKKVAPPAKKGDKVPVYPVLNQHLFIFPRGVLPLVIHRIFMELFPTWTISPFVAFPFYLFAIRIFMTSVMHKLNDLAYRYGYFDGEVPRDKIPDQHSTRVLLSMAGGLTVRPFFAILGFYNQEEKPTLSIWFPLQLFLYSVVLDFFFYIYHRAMHESDFLWKLHQRHHTSKHPNGLMAPFADGIQEFGDLFLIPALTWLILRYDFSTWYMCNLCSLWTETYGHSGIRLYWQAPASGPFLRPLGAELIHEDHDLHHRKGWKKSYSYGKQTALWDTIFGTRPVRLECSEELIDWQNRVH